jgi:hypothetical protein
MEVSEKSVSRSNFILAADGAELLRKRRIAAKMKLEGLTPVPRPMHQRDTQEVEAACEFLNSASNLA